jgi:hypothetical protein
MKKEKYNKNISYKFGICDENGKNVTLDFVNVTKFERLGTFGLSGRRCKNLKFWMTL